MKVFKFIKRLIIFVILVSATIFYAFNVEPNMLTTNKSTIDLGGNRDLKVILFSDTHYKAKHTLDDMMKITEKINEQNPDVVIFAGDLIDNLNADKPNIENITKSMAEINAKYGKYAIMGNHDYGGGAFKPYKEILSKSQFELLINEIVPIDGQSIEILGIDEILLGNPDYSLTKNLDSDKLSITVCHEGDTLASYSNNYDIAFSGHSHGGQINLPFIKDYILPEGSKKYSKGYYKTQKLYVSSGIGTTKVNARLFDIPEIVALNIKY